MKRLFVFAVASLVCVANLFARNIVFADSETYESISDVLVRFKTAGGVTLQKDVKSSSMGTVNVPDDAVWLSATRLGYEPIENHTITDTIFMSLTSLLQEITVTSVRNNFKLYSDRYVYNVAADSALQNASTFEAFRQIPILNVQLNGSISSMQGKQLVYKVNGLTDPLLSGDLQNALLSLKAKYVSKIELIENPNGDNPNLMEVNIVTKGRLEGYMATISANIRDNAVRATLHGITKIKNFSISASYLYLDSYNHDSKTTSLEWRDNSELRYLTKNYSKDGGYKAQTHSFEAAMSYSFDDLTILNASGRAIAKVNPHYNSLAKTELFDNYLNTTAKYSRITTQKQKDKEYEGYLNFEKLFGEHAKDGKLYIGYEFYYRPLTINTYSDFEIEKCEDPILRPDYESYLHVERSTMEMHTVMLDLRRVFEDKHTVFVNGLYRYRNDHASDSLGTPIWQHTGLRQNTGSASVGYKFTIPKLTIRGSIEGRLYNDRIFNTSIGDDYTFSRNSLTWQPTMSVTYTPDWKASYNISFSRNNQIPDINAMNPYVFDGIPGQLSYGNPNLSPEHINTISLGSELNCNRAYIDLSLQWQSASDLILQYRDLDSNGLVNITYNNIAKRNMFTFSPFMSWRPVRATVLRVSTPVDYIRYSSEQLSSSNNGFQFRPNLTVQQDLPWDVYLELSGRYNTPWIGLQGKGGSNFDYAVSASKSFLQQRLRLSLYASAFLPVYYNRTYTTTADNYCYQQTNRQWHANFSFSIIYQFGKLRARVKETEGSISNRDIKSDYDE